MRPILNKFKPTSGVSHVLHLLLLIVLPLVVFVLIRLEFAPLAYAVVVLSKWRIFAVRPRFWAANIRANAVDLMVGLSIVVFMTHNPSILVELAWAVAYSVWLVKIKPSKSTGMIMLQAFIAQLLSLTALYMIWADGPLWGLTFFTGLFCFLAARHFLDTFDEPYAKMLAYIWGYFGAALGWLTAHWLLFYNGMAQPTFLLSALGYGMAVIYYLDHNDRLSRGVRRQFLFIMIAIVLVVLAFSDWGDKVV